jgi:DNA-binding transcriptional regulator YiaG
MDPIQEQIEDASTDSQAPDPRDYAVPSATELRAIRKDLGLQQTTVSDMTGVSDAAISDWENEVSEPSWNRLSKVMHLYGTLREYRETHNPDG